MAEPTSSSAAAGGAFLKVFAPGLFASMSVAILYLLLPPQTTKEWFQRLTVTFICSLFFGPALFFGFMATGTGKEILTTALDLLVGFTIPTPFTSWVIAFDSGYVKLLLAAPFFMVGGLPGWYVLGWGIRWMEKRKGMDAGEVADEVARTYKRLRP